jgi:hypothetical protein
VIDVGRIDQCSFGVFEEVFHAHGRDATRLHPSAAEPTRE